MKKYGILKTRFYTNLRQHPGLSGRVLTTLKPQQNYKYFKTQVKAGLTWYEVGKNQWVAQTGILVTQHI